MSKTAKRTGRNREGHVLGERVFAAITAVEGVSLSTGSRKRLASMKKRKLTNEEQRTEVIRAYSVAKGR
jgi:hypothetical protein